jgi:hypothetical protein
MNRAMRIAFISPLVVALLGGAVFGMMRAGSSGIGCGAEPVAGVAGTNSTVAEGRGIAAVAGDKIVTLEGVGNRSALLPAGGENGVLRHVTSALGVGTAYVSDRKGPDTLITVGPEGISEISAAGEVTHPAWSASGDIVWAEDFQALKLSSPGSQSAKRIARPQGSTAVFSPVFTASDELIAIVQEPVEGYAGEDDSLNNLFRYDIMSDTWSRLTLFQATAEHWSVLRTPVLARDGSVFFVRLRGAASEARLPSYELWSLRGETVSKIRDLPKEMFLAGANDQGLLWNVYDGVEWRLLLEGTMGLVDLGCGAVMVDPRAQPDPDIPREERVTTRRSSREAEAVPIGSASPANAGFAILVGDFSSRQGAEAVASRLGVPGLEIVTHDLAPLAIAPGAWGVARRLPAEADLVQAIEDFRRLFPEYADRSWVVSLAGYSSAG